MNARETPLPRPSARANSRTKPNNASRRRASPTPMRLARIGPRRLRRNARKESRLLAAKARRNGSPRGGKEMPPSRRSGAKHSIARLRISVSVYAKLEREQQTHARSPQTIWRSTLGSEESQAGSPTAFEEPRPQDAGADAAIEGTPAEVAAGADFAVRPDAGVLDDRFAERQPIPMKWHRFRSGARGISI